MPGAVTQSHDPATSLIQAIAAGNVRALDALYAQYGPALLSYLVMRLGDRQLAEEVLQDVMLSVWEHAASFRGESSVYTWLLVIARNRAMNTRRRHTVTAVELNEELASSDTGVHEAFEREVNRSAVQRIKPREW